MLTPSIGFCLIPLTTSGARIPVASRIVGTISMQWWNCARMPPTSLMWPGQLIARPCLVPPKCDAICLVHFERRVEGPRPRHRHVRIGGGRAPSVIILHREKSVSLHRGAGWATRSGDRRARPGRQEIGSGPRLNDIAEPARIECGLG